MNEQVYKISNEISDLQVDKKKVKVQLENEENFIKLQKDLTEFIQKHFLYKLAENDLVINENVKLLQENQESLNICNKEKDNIVKTIHQSEENFQKMQNDSTKLDQTYIDLKKIMQESKENLMSKEEQIKLREASLFTFNSQLNQEKQHENTRKEKLKNLNNQKDKLDKEIEMLNIKINTKLPQEILKKSQFEEYNEIKNKVDVEIFTLKAEHEKLMISINEVSNQMQITEKNKLKLEEDWNNIEKEVANLSSKYEKQEEIIQKNQKESESMKRLYSETENDKLKFENDYEETLKLLNEKTSNLMSFESFKNENLQRKKVTELMRTNSGIKGFLYELVKPIQPKFEIPVKVGLLKFLGYLVVDTNETAKICSEYFKKKEISQDILVLENIPTKEIRSNIRSELLNLGNLLVDFIDCSKINKLQSAINFFLKDLVLCYESNNIQKLKNAGFHFIITMDGTLFRKGTITGGTFKNLNQYSFNYKFQVEEYEAIKNEVLEIQTKLNLLDKERAKYDDLNKYKNVIYEKEMMIESLQKSNKSNRENIDKLSQTIKEKVKSIEQLLSTMNNLQKTKENLKTEEEKIENEINLIKEKFYKEFINKHNLNSIKEFESGTISEMKKNSKELKVLEEKLNKINNEIEALSASEAKIKLLNDTLKSEKEKINQLKSDKQEDQKKYQESKDAFEAYQKNIKKREEKIIDTTNELNAKKGELNKIYERIRSLLKNKSEFDHQINNAIQNKNILFEEAQLSSNNFSFIQNITNNYSYFINLELNLNQFIIERDNFNNLKIDYSIIEKKEKVYEMSIEITKEKSQKVLLKCEETAKEIEKYIKLITLTEEESEKLKEKETELTKKKKVISTELSAIVSELDTKKTQFEKVKKERKEAFESFFNQLCDKLKEVYNDLTKSHNIYGQGGSTYLYNMNVDEPYLGTILYLPTPPGKRVVYDLDQLSGGEKTIAIISLVISLQNLCNTPLIILDEIDSYLDREHEGVLEKIFLKEKDNFQIIIVTHKSNIFRSAQSLIGTYFNKNLFTSVPISVDMRKLENN